MKLQVRFTVVVSLDLRSMEASQLITLTQTGTDRLPWTPWRGWRRSAPCTLMSAGVLEYSMNLNPLVMTLLQAMIICMCSWISIMRKLSSRSERSSPLPSPWCCSVGATTSGGGRTPGFPVISLAALSGTLTPTLQALNQGRFWDTIF